MEFYRKMHIKKFQVKITKLVMQQQKQTSTTNEISNNNNLKSQHYLDNLSRRQMKNDESNNIKKEYDPQ